MHEPIWYDEDECWECRCGWSVSAEQEWQPSRISEYGCLVTRAELYAFRHYDRNRTEETILPEGDLI